MDTPKSYHFGVEIEAIVVPLRVRHPLTRRYYYKKLADAIESYGGTATADRLSEDHRKYPAHYRSWWITADASLGEPQHPLIALEAVSPVLATSDDWENKVQLFWAAFGRVFHGPSDSALCGSHVHVSPSPSGRFTLPQLKRIAYGVVFFEPLVERLLPRDRRGNVFCTPNTRRSAGLSRLTRSRRPPCEGGLRSVRLEIEGLRTPRAVRDLMQQSSPRGPGDRFVLWNFDNVLPSRSGTVEFRGGRGLREATVSVRWVSFVTAFIHLCLSEDIHTTYGGRRPSMGSFWASVRRAAGKLGSKRGLPDEWDVMAEFTSENSIAAQDYVVQSAAPRSTGVDWSPDPTPYGHRVTPHVVHANEDRYPSSVAHQTSGHLSYGEPYVYDVGRERSTGIYY